MNSRLREAIDAYYADPDVPTIGQVVCHEKEPVAMILTEISGDVGTIEWGEKRREYPLRELFTGPSIGRKFLEIKWERAMNCPN